MTEYDKITINGQIPKWMKLIMVFIDRVGFPILAFCLMFLMSYHSLEKVTASLSQNTAALIEFKSITMEFQKDVVVEHEKMCDKLDHIYDNGKNQYGNPRV